MQASWGQKALTALCIYEHYEIQKQSVQQDGTNCVIMA